MKSIGSPLPTTFTLKAFASEVCAKRRDPVMDKKINITEIIESLIFIILIFS
jgi:hypothetical protein